GDYFSCFSCFQTQISLILSILLHIHILRPSSLLISAFLSVQISDPYVNTLQTKVLTILFFSISTLTLKFMLFHFFP
uniref:Uncharacterized protein n=1 Tax=Salarias fasciatus TaxID=181472 RepID=A0A672J3S4_SALFA